VTIYAEALAARGHQVLIAYPAQRSPSLKSKVKSVLKGRGWPREPPPPPSHLEGRTVPQKVIAPWRPIQDGDLPDADVVVATWWETAEWIARLGPQRGKKAYFVQHHEVVFGGVEVDRVKASYRLPLKKIAIARWLVDVMRDEYGDGNVGLVPNSVDLEQFSASPRGKQSVPTIGFIYSQVAFKGSDIMVRALELARAQLPQLRIVAFGPTTPTEPLLTGPGVTYVRNPPQQEIRNLYAQCDAWVVASRSEGFGLPLLEAMACRTPIIATPTGAAPELVEAGGGFLVRHEEPADLCDAILRVARMPDDEWRTLSARANAIASSYTWSDATARFEKELEKIVAG
jgi:glycosyltransferase involved in cell wall biosynthesis